MMNVTGSYGRSSPDTIGPSYSKDVTYTGEVMGNYANGSVSNSYGITFMPIKNLKFRSPSLNDYDNDIAYFVGPDGDVDYYGSWNVTNSYGIQ